MTRCDIKFIAADMDGTLLDENSQLNPRFFDVYRQLQEQDILFAAASGRQYYSLVNTFEPVKDQLLFICENGTLVMHRGQELYSCTLEKAAIHRIVEMARHIDGAFTVLCGKKSAYIETQDPQALQEFDKYYRRCEYVDDLLSVDDDFIKVAICHFGGTEEWVYPVMYPPLGRTHQVVVSGKIWMDIMNINASKGAAMEHLQVQLGITPAQTMSFGDYFNDIEMLQASYYSYAMENAHPKVKQYARFIAPSNRDNGVLAVITHYLEEHRKMMASA